MVAICEEANGFFRARVKSDHLMGVNTLIAQSQSRLSPVTCTMWLSQFIESWKFSPSSIKQNTTYSTSLWGWMSIMECTRTCSEEARHRASIKGGRHWILFLGEWNKKLFHLGIQSTLGSRCLSLTRCGSREKFIKNKLTQDSTT